MRWTLAVAAVVCASRSAFAVDVVLTSQTSKTQIVMTDLPGDKQGELVLVSWQDLAGPEPSGTLVFRREAGQHTEYMPIGGGPFGVVETTEHALVNGTALPVFEVVLDARHSLRLVASRDGKRDAHAMLASYQAHEHVGGPHEGKSAIEAAIKAAGSRVGKACGGSLTADIAWRDFDKAGQLALAKQAVAVLEAAEAACGDADYKAAVAHLRTLHVGYGGDGELAMEQKGATLNITLSPASFNPRESSAKWLREHLEAP